MKKILLISLFALLLAACGGGEPLTVAQIRETAEAEATTAANDLQETLDAREALIGNIAPAGTNISETDPERGHDEPPMAHPPRCCTKVRTRRLALAACFSFAAWACRIRVTSNRICSSVITPSSNSV